jgi:hypothetical protein
LHYAEFETGGNFWSSSSLDEGTPKTISYTFCETAIDFFPADCVLNYSQLQAESLDDAIQIVNRNK